MKKITNHTPGPWEYSEHGIVHGEELDICEIFIYHALQEEEEAKANAKLIAAAPELLLALRGAKQALEIFANGQNVSMEIINANRAIKKATQ